MRSLKDYALLFLKGMAMGSADAVPGVSGGTIALITGIYEELIEAIRSVNLKALRLLGSFRLKELWVHLHADFLAVLLAGIATALITVSRLVLYFLDNYPEVLWAFFFGLIVASALVVGRKISEWSIGVFVSLVVGTAFGYGVTLLTAAETPESLPFIFLSGAVAICAMILPGISGSFILVLLGKYRFIFQALEDLNVKVILTFMAGCLVGILSFSHLINWLLKKYFNATIAFLTGLMIGSLNKVWPWKETLSTYEDRHGELKPLEQANVWPWNYDGEPYTIWAILAALFGFALVYVLERFLTKPTPNTKEEI